MFLYYCCFVIFENCIVVDFYLFLIENGCCFIFNLGENGMKICSIRRVGFFGGFSVIMDV